MNKRFLSYIKNLLLPTLILGGVTGTITGLFIVLYRVAASKVISVSESAYAAMREDLRLVPVGLLVILAIAWVTSLIYKKVPEIQGGGIPTSIAILRGLMRFDWLKSLIGVTVVSLSTFFVGIPLGNEGPSVQIGTAVGRGTVRIFAKKSPAWDRYVMTGGSCAGFTGATNAPISGIMFAIEEAHGRISPMIIMVVFTAVMFTQIAMKLFAPLVGLNPDLFTGLAGNVRALVSAEMWIPLMMGGVIGLFSVVFLKYYKLITGVFKKKLANISMFVKVLVISVLTLIFGLISYDFVSTGHSIVEKLIEGHVAWYILLAILVFRMTVTLGANTTGITGGMFLPIIALSALMTGITGQFMVFAGILDETYRGVIIALGIASCISGMMKCPLTAVVFGVEALGCAQNILPVIIASAIAYTLTEIFGVKSINESVIKNKTDALSKGRIRVVKEALVTVCGDSFAIGKQLRDIFWPSGMFIVSIKRKKASDAVVDEYGEKTIREGDVLHLRYSTIDEESTKQELLAIVGEQELVTSDVSKA